MAANDSTGNTKPTPRAKFTDHEVDLMQELIDQGLSYREIAARILRTPAA